MIRVTQLSDPHFTVGDARSHGGQGYDVRRSLDAVLDTMAALEPPDLVVVTGDVADRGQPSEYAEAARQLSRLPTPVHVLAGNHDYVVPMEAVLPASGIDLSRSVRHDNWLFLFVDSNAGGQVRDLTGRRVDTRERFAARPYLDPGDVAWIDDLVGCTDADHIFLWLHHAPGMPGVFTDADYDRQLAGVLDRHPAIRGVAGGHVHTELVTQVSGRPVFVCPSLTVNVDLGGACLLPPGFRTFELGHDGSIASTGYLLDRPEWPRTPLDEAARSYLAGHIDLPALEDARADGYDTAALFDPVSPERS